MVDIVDDTQINLDDYITIEEFAKIHANVSVKKVISNIENIPGIIEYDGKRLVLKGTRYLFNMRNFKVDTMDKKRYILLKAINQCRYISSDKLMLYENEFIIMIQELEQAGLIKSNNSLNKYGANSYNCTIKGSEYLKYKQPRAIIEISKAIASIGGAFLGSYVSQRN